MLLASDATVASATVGRGQRVVANRPGRPLSRASVAR